MKASRGTTAKTGSVATDRPRGRLLPIIARFRESAQEIPKRELNHLPADFIENLDHYIYGTPKK
jgi:hypothetical protein